MDGLADLDREPLQKRMNPPRQIELFHSPIAQLIKLHPETETTVLGSFNESASLQDNQGPMYGALRHLHAVGNLRKAERNVALAKQLHKRDDTAHAIQSVGARNCR